MKSNKKLFWCVYTVLTIVLSFKVFSADEHKSAVTDFTEQVLISTEYSQIDFSQADRLSFDAFAKAYHGYLNLLNDGKLNKDRQIISICDFNLPSSKNRLWIIDLATHKILFNTYVAHGQGSGEDVAESFSNKNNSHQSSLGFYVTGDTYEGDHGTSLRLNGMDEGFNDAALDRGIVVHGADYVSEKFIAENDRLGRSWGCPAVREDLKIPIINAIQGGTCLFIYYPDSKYMKTAYWLNKKIDHMPEPDFMAGLSLPATRNQSTNGQGN